MEVVGPSPKFWDYLYDLRANGTLCDIQLCVKTEMDTWLAVPAHKLVLVASSKFFQGCLNQGELLDAYNFDGVTAENIQLLLDYMYRRLSWDQVMQNAEASEAARILEVVRHHEPPQQQQTASSDFPRLTHSLQDHPNKPSYMEDQHGHKMLVIKMVDGKRQQPRAERASHLEKSKRDLLKPKRAWTKTQPDRVIITNLQKELANHNLNYQQRKSAVLDPTTERGGDGGTSSVISVVRDENIGYSPTPNIVLCHTDIEDLAAEAQIVYEGAMEEHKESERHAVADSVLPFQVVTQVHHAVKNVQVGPSLVSLLTGQADDAGVSGHETPGTGQAYEQQQHLEEQQKPEQEQQEQQHHEQQDYQQDNEEHQEDVSQPDELAEESDSAVKAVKHEKDLQENVRKPAETKEHELKDSTRVGSPSVPSEVPIAPDGRQNSTSEAEEPVESLGAREGLNEVDREKEEHHSESPATVPTSAAKKVIPQDMTPSRRSIRVIKRKHPFDVVVEDKAKQKKPRPEQPPIKKEKLDANPPVKKESQSSTPPPPPVSDMPSRYATRKSGRLATVDDAEPSKHSSSSPRVVSGTSEDKRKQTFHQARAKVDHLKSVRGVKRIPDKRRVIQTVDKAGGESNTKESAKKCITTRGGKRPPPDKAEEESPQKEMEDGEDLMKSQQETQVPASPQEKTHSGNGHSASSGDEDRQCQDDDDGDDNDILSPADIKVEKMDPGRLARHMCLVCKKVFKNSTGLIVHERWKHGAEGGIVEDWRENVMKCNMCSRTFRGFNALAMHQKMIHKVEISMKCDCCDEAFPNKKKLNIHRVNHHGAQLFKCDHCKATFKSREGWKIHLYKQHSSDKPSQMCYVCGKVFKMKHELRNHLRVTHTATRDFPCHLCDRAFKEKAGLKRHLTTYHSNQRDFHCPDCGMMFKTSADMRKHHRIHLRKKSTRAEVKGEANKVAASAFCCTYCGKAFKKAYQCRSHEKIVHISKEEGTMYVCTVCNKSFSVKHYLMAHIKAAHRPKCYQCPQCHYKFAHKYMIRNHLPKCKGYPESAKPFRCQECGKSFNLKGNLTKHMQFPARCRGPVAKSFPDYVVLMSSEDSKATEDAQGVSQAEEMQLHQQQQQQQLEAQRAMLLDVQEQTGVSLDALQASQALQQLQASGAAPTSTEVLVLPEQTHHEHLQDTGVAAGDDIDRVQTIMITEGDGGMESIINGDSGSASATSGHQINTVTAADLPPEILEILKSQGHEVQTIMFENKSGSQDIVVQVVESDGVQMTQITDNQLEGEAALQELVNTVVKPELGAAAVSAPSVTDVQQGDETQYYYQVQETEGEQVVQTQPSEHGLWVQVQGDDMEQMQQQQQQQHDPALEQESVQ